MESYIIRIIAEMRMPPYNIIGPVEMLSEAKTPFHNTQELAEILMALTLFLSHKERGKWNSGKRKNNRLKLRLPVKIEGVDDMGDKFSKKG